MFLLLTRVLIGLLLIAIIYYLVAQLIPKKYLTWLGGLALIIVLLLTFLDPNSDQFVSSTSKIFSFPFKPLGLSLIFLLFGVTNRKKEKLSHSLILTTLIILLVSSFPFFAYRFAQQAEMEAVQLSQSVTQPPAIDDPCCKDKDQAIGAIVLLGQGTTQPNLPYHTQIQLNDTGDRILYAAQLYKQQVADGNSPIIIVSAGAREEIEDTKNNAIESYDIKTILETMGVPSGKIVIEAKGVDLYKSAIEVSKILSKRNIRNRPIFLISSALNMRRATLTFVNQQIRKVIPKPTNFYTFPDNTTPKRKPIISDFIPSVEAFLITTRVVEEYFASIYYFVRGWLSPLPL